MAFGLSIRKRPKAEIKARVTELLELVHLEQFADRYPSQLSGGQRQRMALARALAVEPEVLLLDEPFGALDAQVRKELRTWLRRLHDEVHVTTVFVTHDQEEAMDVADTIVVIAKGTVEQVGTPDELYDRPANDFVMSFLGPVTQLAGALVRPHDLEIVLEPDGRRGDRHRGARRARSASRCASTSRPPTARPGCSSPAGKPIASTCRAGARVGVRAVRPPTTEVPADATVEPAARRPRRLTHAPRCCTHLCSNSMDNVTLGLDEPIETSVRISAKADYAVRAVIELAAAPEGTNVSAREIAAAQEIPQNFLENILAELRRAGIVHTHRGPGGGSSLARPADTITVGEILLAIDGPLAAVRDLARSSWSTRARAHRLPEVWCRVQSCLHELLDGVTVADLAGRRRRRAKI